MNAIPTGFRITVLVTVTTIGGGCGAIVGRVYSNDPYWWAGMIAGAVSGLVLAQVYLNVLSRLSPVFGRVLRGIVGTATGVGCGAATAVLIQAFMVLLTYEEIRREAPEGILVVNVLPFVFAFGIVLGAGVGFLLGALFSVIHVYQQRSPGTVLPLSPAIGAMPTDCFAQQTDRRGDHG